MRTAQNDPRILVPQELAARGVASMAVLPLLVAHEVVGVIALFADEAGFFDDDEMHLLTDLAGDIGFAMDHLDKEERLNYLAYYDDITGLPNRTPFLERSGQHLRPREGAKTLLGMGPMDISRFRFVNDTLGRQEGDELLKQVAQRLQQAAGDAYDVARIGVNSFGIAVTDARDAGAVALALDGLMRACFDAPLCWVAPSCAWPPRPVSRCTRWMVPMQKPCCATLGQPSTRPKASADSLLFYTSEMNTRVAEALSLEGRLRDALEQAILCCTTSPSSTWPRAPSPGPRP